MTPQDSPYVGRHRDDSAAAAYRSALLDYRHKWSGTEYVPRHNASHRKQVQA